MFILSMGYIPLGPWISQLFRQPEIDNVDKIGILAGVHDGGGEVAVDEVPGVHVFDVRSTRAEVVRGSSREE